MLGITYAFSSRNAGEDEAAKAQQTAQSFYDSYDFSKPIEIPALARGAVIPGGKPWLAMLGDQPAGQTNIEAPLSTIQEALQAVLDRNGNNPTNVNVTFRGSLSQLARVLMPEIEIAKKRNSVF